MDAELKAKWLEALRSGKYKQGNGVLRTDDNCFCCLGVLADIVNPSGWGREGKYNTWTPPGSVEYGTAYLPYKFEDEIGLNGHSVNLSVMNDGIMADEGFEQAPKSFNEIADYIEKKL